MNARVAIGVAAGGALLLWLLWQRLGGFSLASLNGFGDSADPADAMQLWSAPQSDAGGARDIPAPNLSPDQRQMAMQVLRMASAANAALGVDEFPSLDVVMGICEQESRFNPNALGTSGEIGLMQIMPSTGMDMGYTPDSLRDPATNVACGIKLLVWLDRYIGQKRARPATLDEILSAYNAGVGNLLNRGIVNSAYVTSTKNRIAWWTWAIDQSIIPDDA